MDIDMNFEQKLKTLDTIAQKMESGDLSLEDSVKSYEEAMTIIKDCEAYIQNAKIKIEKISDGEIKEV